MHCILNDLDHRPRIHPEPDEKDDERSEDQAAGGRKPGNGCIFVIRMREHRDDDP